MKYLDPYFDTLFAVLKRLRETQHEAIQAAGEAMAAALAGKGAIAVMDTGHMLKHEAFMRAGGLMAVVPFSYELRVEGVEGRQDAASSEARQCWERDKIALALNESGLRAGDLLIINSNSGRTFNVVETALQAGQRDIVTLGISSREQMQGTEADHPSGQKLLEVVRHAVDNCAPFGDAALETDGNEAMCPMSGIAAAAAFWAVQASAVSVLEAQGLKPTLFRSVHLGGQEHIGRQREHFERQGF